MRKYIFVLAIPLMATFGAAPSHANALMNMALGAKVEGVATMGNKQVPLPDGVWELVYAATNRPFSVDIGNALLVRKANGKGVGFILVRANLQPGAGRGWNRPRYCSRNDVHHNGSDSNYNREDANCWIVSYFVAQNRLRFETLRKLRDQVRQHAGTSTLVNTWSWINDYSDFLSVTYYVNPTAYGLPADRDRRWVDSNWHVEAVAGGSDRRRFIDAVKAFGDKYRDAVRKGFRNRLGGELSGLKFSFDR